MRKIGLDYETPSSPGEVLGFFLGCGVWGVEVLVVAFVSNFVLWDTTAVSCLSFVRDIYLFLLLRSL